MADLGNAGVAIVIDNGEMVLMLCDILESMGYRAISAPTHARAAEQARGLASIALLAACVPAPDESGDGVYLAEAARTSKNMAVVLMLADPAEESPKAPPCAVKIVKPFGYKAFVAAIERAEAKAAS